MAPPRRCGSGIRPPGLIEKRAERGAGRRAQFVATARFNGRLVLMLDSDARVRPGALETMASVLDSDPGVGLVGPRLV